MNSWFRKHFGRLTPAEVAAEDLAIAELSKLNAEKVKEHAEAAIAQHTACIKRTRKFLTELESA